jgi:hypothetical protein
MVRAHHSGSGSSRSVGDGEGKVSMNILSNSPPRWPRPIGSSAGSASFADCIFSIAGLRVSSAMWWNWDQPHPVLGQVQPLVVGTKRMSQRMS